MKLDNDMKQRLTTIASFLLEFYKVLMATLLGIFVPQMCNDSICSYSQNIYNTDSLHIAMNICNSITFISVIVFYGYELNRENWSIKYLDIDKTKPNSNLDHEIEQYPNLKSKLHIINKHYQHSVYTALGLMIINFLLSAIVIGITNPSTQTGATFVSFFLLVIGKLTAAKSIADKSLKKERVYSSYLKTTKTYNTIDTDHVIASVADEAQNNCSQPVDVDVSKGTTDGAPDILSKPVSNPVPLPPPSWRKVR